MPAPRPPEPSSLPVQGRRFLYLALPEPRPEGAEELAELAGIGLYEARRLAARAGLHLLPARREVEELAERLEAHEYRAAVVREEALFEAPFPPRAVAARVEEHRIALLDRHGEQLLELGPEDEILLVVADLSPSRLDAGPAARVPPARRLLEKGQGEPALRVFKRGDPRGVLVLGKRFNYPSLGERAGLSSIQNYKLLLSLLEERAERSRRDLRFPLLRLPPVPLDRWTREGQAVAALELHARVVRELWEAGLLDALPGDVEDSTPLVEAAEQPRLDPEAAALLYDSRRKPGPLGRVARQLSLLGPPALVGPLAAAALLAAGLGFVWPPAMALAYVLGGAVLLVASHAAWRRKRVVEDFPTSKARSLAMGPVELVGRAVARVPLKAPFSGVPCVWYEAELYRAQGRADSLGRPRWVLAGRLSSGQLPFYLEDETGRVLVDPLGATFDVHRVRRHRGLNPLLLGGELPPSLRGELRSVERVIPVGAPVYVLGTARPAPRREWREELLERLRALKRDRERLMAFDADGNGLIDEEEWERAVESVERELLEERLQRSEQEEAPPVVGRGPPGTLFLVSDHEEAGYRKVLALRAWGAGVGGLLLVLFGFAGLLEHLLGG